MPDNTETSNRRPVELIIYDLDGTLIDSFTDIWHNVNHVFMKYDLPPLPYETVKGHVGDGVRKLLRRCLRGLDWCSLLHGHKRLGEGGAQGARIFDRVL